MVEMRGTHNAFVGKLLMVPNHFTHLSPVKSRYYRKSDPNVSWIQLAQDMGQWWTFMNTMEETGVTLN